MKEVNMIVIDRYLLFLQIIVCKFRNEGKHILNIREHLQFFYAFFSLKKRILLGK